MAEGRQHSLVSLRDVGRRFDNGTVALDALSFAVGEGSLVTLLGPSGCGKSTALRLIAGLDRPSAGELLWRDGPPAPGDIGFVFQEPTLMPWASVADNVRLPLRLRGGGRGAGTAVATAIERVGLADFATARPHQLSGGMKMRVSLARALLARPRLLLLDEPFAALDEITRFRLDDELLALWREVGCTVVFVTHSVFEAVYLSQRILVMTPRPGRVFAEIAVAEPYPRGAAFRGSADYLALCRQTSERLEAAMEAETRLQPP